MNVDFFDASGTNWTGNMRLVYARTWAEIDNSGNLLQVWRFLMNGDLRVLTPLPIPCPVPPCAPVHGNKARFTGYIDFVRDCNNQFQNAWMLTHACDAIDHHFAFPRGGAFHPDRAYTFLGPAAGFVPGPFQPTEGTAGSPFETVRRRRFPAPGTTGPIRCEYEEPANHVLTPQQQLCQCGPLAAPPQWMIGDLTVVGSCGTNIFVPPPPGVYLPGFMSMAIGAWTSGAFYPGPENLRWNAGGYNYTEACSALVRRDVFYGVSTFQGFPAFQMTSAGMGPPLPPIFIDQANSVRLPSPLSTVMNVPYLSDHVISLNH